ncbi:hypothetical protein, conserved [Eimeria acervulina]|uniref:Uncharacterized protein n=1 Tax=Eimeria acervulina TaxID=5801 RepID=U6G9M0_EIMAC|nr:hypothetical protein, conserved [Eimeria acervulina]CDI76966.1 hypothetical protein, conserved [Eimeria acervulina]
MSSSADDEVEEALKGLKGVGAELQTLLHSICRKATAIASTSGFDSFTSEAPSQVSADDASAAAAAAAGAAAAAEAAAAEAEILEYIIFGLSACL